MKYLMTIILMLWTSICIHAQELETLIQEGLINNPSIQKLDYKYQIATEEVNKVNTLPNTEFNFGFMAVRPEMEMPMERFSVSAMQMLPWFGTLPAKKDYANSLAEVELVNKTIAERKLSLSISQLYYQLYEIKAEQHVLAQNKTLLQTFEKLALSSVSVGQASPVDVMRLQIRQNELQEEIDVLNQKREGLQAALNSLMNRPLDTPITIAVDLNFPEEEPIFSNEMLAYNPELIKYDKLFHSVEQSEMVNQQEGKPLLGVGIEYINQENSPMITSSFKDMIMPMVSLSVPLFNQKHQSVTVQNEIKKQEIQAQKEEQLNRLTAELAQAVSLRKQARIKYNVQEKNLKIAKNAEKILLKNYETGTINYDEILKMQELQLKFQRNQVGALKTYYDQTVLIQYLIQP
ncbi:TolC family protein [Flavobacteriaceae bacterium Ap0902]|nr:TolC family protein [Flavobacteriaceae bacterium Ap0902]